jgi:hypothetical protein
VEQVLSVDTVGRWKPVAAPYLHAADATGTDPSRVALIAAHAFDVHGAPPYFAAADLSAPTLDAWAEALLRG